MAADEATLDKRRYLIRVINQQERVEEESSSDSVRLNIFQIMDGSKTTNFGNTKTHSDLICPAYYNSTHAQLVVPSLKKLSNSYHHPRLLQVYSLRPFPSPFLSNIPDFATSVNQFHGSHQKGLGEEVMYDAITVPAALKAHLL